MIPGVTGHVHGRRHGAGGAVLVAALTALTACGAPTGATTRSVTEVTASTTVAAATAAPCTPDGVIVTLSPTYGSTGDGYLDLRVTDTGTEPCSLTGYPTVDLVDAAGTSVAQAVQDPGDTTTVVLAPHDVASAQLSALWITQDGTPCTTDVPAFAVTLPGATTSQTFPHPMITCARVSPFVAGRGAGGE